jgi:hypothetical protein
MKGNYRIALAAAALAILAVAGPAPVPPPEFVPRPPVVRPRPPVFEPRPPLVEPRPPVFEPRPPGFEPRPLGFEPHAPGFEPHQPGFEPNQPVFRPRPNPVEVRVEVEGVTRTEPGRAIEILGGTRGQVLPPSERVALTRQAVDQLAVKVETHGNALKSLEEVRTAVRQSEGIDPEFKQTLKLLEPVAERRVLADSAKEIRVLSKDGRWAEAARQARECLKQIPATEGSPKGPQVQARAEVREALSEIATVGERAGALDRLGQALQTAGREQPAETVASLQGFTGKTLPADLRGPVEGLRGLSQLRDAAGADAGRPPDVAAIKNGAADFERAIAALPGGKADPTLVKQVQQDLAVKAFLDGHPAEARSLLPADGPAEHAANLLRDMKAIGLGEGKVTTWPAERALTPEPGKGGDGARGPPRGMEPLIPEGAREGWRPPARESAKADLPPIEKAAQLGKALQSDAETGLKAECATLDQDARKAGERMQAADLSLRSAEAADNRRFAEIGEKLGRELKPGERAHVRLLVSQDKTNGQILAALQNQKDDGDDEQFLKDVATQLGRELTDDERRVARELRRTGLKAAEVANKLREAGAPPAPPPKGDDD